MLLACCEGDCFAERCELCGHEYIRDFEMESVSKLHIHVTWQGRVQLTPVSKQGNIGNDSLTSSCMVSLSWQMTHLFADCVACQSITQVGFKRTGRMCTKPGCGGHLKDHILDWEDGLPDDELDASEEHASDAVSFDGGSSAMKHMLMFVRLAAQYPARCWHSPEWEGLAAAQPAVAVIRIVRAVHLGRVHLLPDLLCPMMQDVSLCLGTSLQIYPAANLPLRTLKSGGSMAIINLQVSTLQY